MSINQSDLSASQFGYDFVVATTLESLNATMFQFIEKANMPQITKYYWYKDKTNTPVEVDLKTLLATKQSNSNPSGTANVDPASVVNWDGTGTAPTGIKELGGSSFACGFKAEIGIPPGFALPGAPNPQTLPVLPNMVTFDQTSLSVTFNLYCSSFQVFQPAWARFGLSSYLNQSQPSGSAWYLQTTIPISKILDNKNLPKAVQDQLNAMGSDFSVQRLFIDLDQPSKATASSVIFGGITPGSALQTVIAEVFTGTYCTTLNQSGMPALGYTILPNTPPHVSSSLHLGSMELEVVPYNNPAGGGNTEPGLDTFNYLCSEGATPPPANLLTWNWFDTQAEAINYSGVVAVNRNALIKWLAPSIYNAAKACCYSPSVRVWLSGFLGTTVNYSWSLTGYQNPTVTYSTTGSTVYKLNWSSPTASDSAGLGGDMGKMELSSSYSASVDFSGNTITITQNLIIYVSARGTFGVSASGNAVNKTITDTYTLDVTQNGQLSVTRTSKTSDDANIDYPGAFRNFWGSNIKKIEDDVADWAKNLVATSFTDIPVSTMQSFVFPGGNPFAYASVTFSDNQDLVSHITYTNPA